LCLEQSHKDDKFLKSRKHAYRRRLERIYTIDKSTSESNCNRHAEGIETKKKEVDGVFVVIFAQHKQNCMKMQNRQQKKKKQLSIVD